MVPLYRRYYLLPLFLIIPFVLYWPGDWGFYGTNTQGIFRPTQPIPDASSASRSQTLVVARLKEANVDWIGRELPGLQTAIYVVDDPFAGFRVPRNRGHEAMVYLTYIIDHYDNLPDVAIFTHSDQITWHNNDLLDSDLVKMIKRLNSDRVIREKYFALRCHLQPGCSDNLHLNRTEANIHKPEENIIRKVWAELHPLAPVPETLSAPCCGQFAVSREAIRSWPLARYLQWRRWLLTTDLSDIVSGRIWEYTWHYVFSGKPDLCPDAHMCYCDGYGVCMESKAALNAWLELDEKRKGLEDELRDWEKEHQTSESEQDRNLTRNRNYQQEIDEVKAELERLKQEALARGDDPVKRRKALAS